MPSTMKMQRFAWTIAALVSVSWQSTVLQRAQSADASGPLVDEHFFPQAVSSPVAGSEFSVVTGSLATVWSPSDRGEDRS